MVTSGTSVLNARDNPVAQPPLLAVAVSWPAVHLGPASTLLTRTLSFFNVLFLIHCGLGIQTAQPVGTDVGRVNALAGICVPEWVSLGIYPMS